jgi:aryl-phospho-beta-D-glucosidase BglC (GH1 family)
MLRKPVLISFVCLALNVCHAAPKAVPSAPAKSDATRMSAFRYWRGFNLSEKRKLETNASFKEEDFKWISGLGFNYVRLPLDYRIWIKDGDWNKIDDSALNDIDQAIEWGKRYGLHVCLNFHRAPGYCINEPREPLSVWTDPEAQKVCVRHWAYFAKRYKGVPSSQLSFNPFNEPLGVDPRKYMRAVSMVVEAIRKEDPDRLIVVDGNDVGTKPLMELLPLKVAQSYHAFAPFGLTHYKAYWIENSDKMATPQWPVPQITGYLYGPMKPNLQAPWVIEGTFDQEMTLTIHVDTVSTKTILAVLADGKPVMEKLFDPGPGAGEWKKSIFKKEWDIYQNVYDQDYTAKIPAKTRTIQMLLPRGDWISFSSVSLAPASGGETTLFRPTVTDWGVKPVTLSLDPQNRLDKNKMPPILGKEWIEKTHLKPWLLLKRMGGDVMVGEWGVYRETPHDVALAWMKDNLELWKKAGIGWALWDFRGEFGVLDSERKDVEYEDWNGHKLDREMLDLLQAY